MKIKIYNRLISSTSPPYVIAEIGSNFDQSLNKALRLINVAKNCGADAVKFQLFSGKKLYPNNKKMRKLFEKHELNSKWISILKKHCLKIRIHFFLSVFDEESLDVIIKNKIKLFKIASSEITNLSLLKKIAMQKKPIFVSTGMSDLDDVKRALKVTKSQKNNKIILMQCGSLYPLDDEKVNLNVLDTFKKKFKCILGFSDHTLGCDAAMVALGKGSVVFEKHITLNKKNPGPDHHYAMNPQEFKTYVRKLKNCYKMLGDSEKKMLDDEKKIARRDGLYFKNFKRQNTLIKKDDLYIKRPCLGLRAKYLSKIINKRLIKGVKKHSPVFLKNIK